MTQALLFGGIGTLIETSELQRAAFNAAFKEAGLDWHWQVDEYRDMLHTPGGAARILGYAQARSEPDFDSNRAMELHLSKTRHFHALLREGKTEARPGVDRVINQCRAQGIKLAFATTTDEATVAAVLDAIGYSPAQFDFIAHRQLVDAPKPDGAVYRLCLDALGVRPSDAIAVEDSSSGLAAANNAGISCIVTPGSNTEEQDFSAALTVVSHLGDVGHPYRWLSGAQPGSVDFIEVIEWLDAGVVAA